MFAGRWLVVIAALTAVVVEAASADAQPFPTRPIRLVVPYPAGGPTDALARILAAEMQPALGQPVIVESKPGASGALGTREVARAEPDGHTIVLGTNQTHATNVMLLKEPGYDPQRDFVAVAGAADLQHALVVSKTLAVASVGDLVALAKRDPGRLNYGSTGVGSASHLTMALFLARTGTQMTHVPFRGAAPLALEIVAGRIDAAFATLPGVLGQIEAGEMRALALASDHRAPQLPALPLLAEQGVRDSEGDAWLALFAPARTPVAVVARLEAAVLGVLAKPDVKAGAIKLGIAVNPRDSRAFTAYLDREIAKWAEVVRVAGFKPERENSQPRAGRPPAVSVEAFRNARDCFAPASSTTWAHSGSSRLMRSANALASPGSASRPSERSRAWTSATARNSPSRRCICATISGGRPAGPTSPLNVSISKPAMPVSITVGTSGNCGTRFALDTASGLISALPACASTSDRLANIIGRWPASTSFIAGAPPR